MNDFEKLYNYLNDLWLTNTPNDNDPPEVKAERNAICTGLDMAIEAVREFAVKCQPRVMTLEEVQRTKLRDDYLWLETVKILEGMYCLQIYGHAGGLEFGQLDDTCCFDVPWDTAEFKWDNYGKTWRCWTSRPTDAQREAVKWE